MNIFAPYRVEEDSSSKLHLVDPALHKSILFIVTRIFPLLLIVGAVFVVAAGYNEAPTTVLLLFAITILITTTILLTRKNLLELVADNIGFSITYQMLFSKQVVHIPYADIEQIYYRMFRGKAPGFYYSVVLKSGKRYRLFKLSRHFLDHQKLLLVNEKLYALTNVPVIKK